MTCVKKVHMVSLGCPKNRVDSEVMVGLLEQGESYQMVPSPEDADVVVVNTCGFIDSAKEESIQTILEMAELKSSGNLKKLVVTGCLSQRYASELEVELPEVDNFLGTQTFPAIRDAVEGRLHKRSWIEPGSFIMGHQDPRTHTIQGGSAYLKIAEGCSRSCAFCIIPKIRGKQQSRTIDDVLQEAMFLGQSGVKELVLVAQDMTSYGLDLVTESTTFSPGHVSHRESNRDSLIRLVRSLDEQPNDIAWVRLLYMYPWNFTDELLDCFSSLEKLVPYVDMPLQHISSSILKSMRRHISRERQMELIDRIRAVEEMVLRTTFIVGYPGETDDDFQQLCDWVQEVQFDRVGVFTFSPEEGTLAATLPNQVPQHVMEERRDHLMALQQEISLAHNREWIGEFTKVIVDGISSEHELVFEGRHYGQAPEIDGVVYLSFEHGGDLPRPGDLVEVQVVDATEYDLMGVVVPKNTIDLDSLRILA